jgi:hypothetical protein
VFGAGGVYMLQLLRRSVEIGSLASGNGVLEDLKNRATTKE